MCDTVCVQCWQSVRHWTLTPSVCAGRLSEFKNTPSSSLTVEEFMTVDLEDEMDPPAFTKSRKKDKERISHVRSLTHQASPGQTALISGSPPSSS